MSTRCRTRRPRHDRAWLPLLLLFICLTPSLLVAGCHAEEHEAHEEATFRLVASHPRRQDVVVTREYVCQVQSSRHIELKALERGYIERVAVAEGQAVTAGQLMFAIQPQVYRAELDKATAEVAAARVEYENTRTLAQGNVVSASELALAEARYQKAQAEAKLAAAHLAFTEIRAPFAGLMDRLEVREGSLVEEGELLTTLADNRAMWVYFNVPEAEYLDYATQPPTARRRPVRLRLANGQFFAETGFVTVIEADFHRETGTIPFRADFPNPAGLLRHGQTCNILLDTPIAGAVLIPQKATFEVLDHTYVYVLDAGGVVRQRRVTVREGLEDLFIVTEGLSEGDLVLMEGLRQVRDGQQVQAEQVPTDSAFAHLKLHAE
ncbi:MAG: efflux RND transporter periplasmic adaptor subunit [Gemmatimonadaceae bacterium]|jgi:membrane fusion protein (multidrug efflux system)|nr:efflux RND transporter periplasmic adaptor subunit [Gemmatimonadaceae bacterium]